MKPSMESVHPELQQAASKMGQLPISARTLWFVRLLMKILIRPSKNSLGVQISNILITGADPKRKLRVRIYKPEAVAANAPALLWMHGGGMVIGVPEQDDYYVLTFVRDTGAIVVSVDYRLAPEHPFPAPLEDCYTAWQWLLDQGDNLGIDTRRLAIGGDSAGAGLAASLAQRLNDLGGVQPVFQLLVYPMLDDRTAARTDIDPEAHFAWNNTANRFGWESYLKQPCGAEVVPADSVPARRVDLSGLPPAWIGVGTNDLFYDEDVKYAERLEEAGVPCELVTVPGAFHGFDVVLDARTVQPPVTRKFRGSQVQALKKAFHLDE